MRVNGILLMKRISHDSVSKFVMNYVKMVEKSTNEDEWNSIDTVNEYR
jgi:hypothetical protein